MQLNAFGEWLVAGAIGFLILLGVILFATAWSNDRRDGPSPW